MIVSTNSFSLAAQSTNAVLKVTVMIGNVHNIPTFNLQAITIISFPQFTLITFGHLTRRLWTMSALRPFSSLRWSA